MKDNERLGGERCAAPERENGGAEHQMVVVCDLTPVVIEFEADSKMAHHQPRRVASAHGSDEHQTAMELMQSDRREPAVRSLPESA